MSQEPRDVQRVNAGLACARAAPILTVIIALVGCAHFTLQWGPLLVALGVAAYFVFPKIKVLAAKVV